MYEYKFQVLECHLDTFGHVNHATYLQLFEQARWEFITERGWGLKEVQESGIGPVILEVKVKYKRELRNRQWITILSELKNFRGKLGTIYQRMVNERGEECSEIEILYGVFDLKNRKLMSPPPNWGKAFGISGD
jgi:acyl-CoA thioester hydrolase